MQDANLDSLVTMSPSSPTRPPEKNPLQERARKRVRQWIATSGINQTMVCEKVGMSQPWLSRFLSGTLDADVDTLQKLAEVFNHSLITMLDLTPDPEEFTLLEMIRSLPAESRRNLRMLLASLVRARQRNRKETDK